VTSGKHMTALNELSQTVSPIHAVTAINSSGMRRNFILCGWGQETAGRLSMKTALLTNCRGVSWRCFLVQKGKSG
jgi:hypothetical protein